jgi:hypothetical protein
MKFKVIRNDSIEFIEANPDYVISKEPVALGSLMLLMQEASRQDMTVTQQLLIAEAMRQNCVTVKEAMDAFWKAYGDPYVSGGIIEFRHLMKHVNEARKERNEMTLPLYD